MQKYLSLFIIFVFLILLSVNLSITYANTAVNSANGVGSVSNTFYYNKITVSSLNNKILNSSGQLAIVDIRDRALFENGHIASAKNIDAYLLADLITTTSLDIAKPLVIVGEDAALTDFFAKLASFYGYEVYVLDGGYKKWVNSGYEIVVGSNEKKSVSELDIQNFIDIARQVIDVTTTALVNITQNLDTLVATSPENMSLLGDVLNNITTQINRLRENPVIAEFLPTDSSLGDVLLDIFVDDRGIRNDAHTEGVVDALNVVGMGPSRRDERRMDRNDRFARRQVIGAANDLVETGYNDALVEALELQGADLSRRDERRMDRNERFARRQVIGTANDLKAEGFNEGVTDTLALLGIDVSRRDERRMNRSERNQRNSILDAKNEIALEGYDKGYENGYNDGYNKGLMIGLTSSGISGFRINRLERKQNRVLFENFSLRDNRLERRIDKIEERVGARKLRRFNRQERHDEFRDYGIIKKGRTLADFLTNGAIVSDALWGLPGLTWGLTSSLLSFIPYAGLVTPVIGLGVRVLTGVARTGVGFLGDDSYRTQLQRDYRVTRNLRNDLRRTNRQDRIVGFIPFERINPVDNLVQAHFDRVNNRIENERGTRLDQVLGQVFRQDALEQRFEQDALDDVTIYGDRIRDFVDNWYVSMPLNMGVGLGTNLAIGGIGTTISLLISLTGYGAFLEPFINIGSSWAGSFASYLWDVAYGTVANDYASRVSELPRSERRDNRQERRQARQAERQFGVENVQPNILQRLQFGPEGVNGELLSSLQFGPSGEPIGNTIEIIRTIISPSREERQQNRAERQERMAEFLNNMDDNIFTIINRIRAAVNLEPISKEESEQIMHYLQMQQTN
ncbi:MAG: rhodanese-like domain-containing protein [Deferribacterota bacterium]|nr:rhodanese-like domain-containing protein [Deferribacterota bacterium]